MQMCSEGTGVSEQRTRVTQGALEVKDMHNTNFAPDLNPILLRAAEMLDW